MTSSAATCAFGPALMCTCAKNLPYVPRRINGVSLRVGVVPGRCSTWAVSKFWFVAMGEAIDVCDLTSFIQ